VTPPPLSYAQDSGGVDVGGFRLFYNCQGTGSPTIVLVAGLSDAGLPWDEVKSSLRDRTRTCVYHRAGLGKSDAPPAVARTSDDMMVELHKVMAGAVGMTKPYLLVGHSIAGLHLRVFHAKYASEVAGMVLVDPSHPDQTDRFASWIPLTPTAGEPACYANYRDLLWTDTRNNPERFDWGPSAAQVRALATLGALPLTVISRAPGDPSWCYFAPTTVQKGLSDAWEKMQKEITALSTKGTRIVATSPNHYVQTSQPELVSGAVLSMVTAIRGSR
jgi:pimeloyl-ACP methyl ester carboxylesterase